MSAKTSSQQILNQILRRIEQDEPLAFRDRDRLCQLLAEGLKESNVPSSSSLPRTMPCPQQLSPQSQSPDAVHETGAVEHLSLSPGKVTLSQEKEFFIRFITPGDPEPIPASARYHGDTNRISDATLERLGIPAKNGRVTLCWSHLNAVNHDGKTRLAIFDVVPNGDLKETDVEFCLETDTANARSAPTKHSRPTDRGEYVVASTAREQSASPSETSRDSDSSSWDERMLERLMTVYEDIRSRRRGREQALSEDENRAKKRCCR